MHPKSLATAAAAALFALAPLARAEIVERIAGIVNGQPIALSDVKDRVSIELARLAEKVPPGPERDKQQQELLHRALDQLVDDKLIEADSAAYQVDVTEEDVNRSVEALAKQNGMTSAQFKEAIEAQKINFAQVREGLKRQALRFRLLQQRVKPRKITDEEIQAAYAAMAASPEQEIRARHLYLRIPPGARAKQLAAAQTKADKALARVKAGEEFAVVARELSDGPTAHEGGDLGYFKRGMLLPELERAAIALPPGQTSGLIKTTSGFHLVKVEDKRSLPSKPLAEVKDQLYRQLADEANLKEQDRFLAQLRKSAQVDLRL